MKRWLGLLSILAVLGAPSSGSAEKGSASLEDMVQQFRLANGLTILVVENDESPTIGLVTAFAVGAAEERPGINGVTHILEHMLFKGTTEVGTSDWEAERVHFDRIEELTQEMKREEAKGKDADAAKIESALAEREKEMEAAKRYAVDNELWGLYEGAGGTNLNAFTSPDVTAYILSIPSNRLELWMYLESQRLRRPILRQFYTEVQNVLEERRMGVDNDPQGTLIENMLATAYDAHWYGYPVIGYPSDIASLTRTETEEWFRVYYAPNRMTLSIVGDVDAKEVLKMAREYFEDVPAQEPPEPLQTFDLEKKGARRVEVEHDSEPRIAMAWHKPNVPHATDAALRVASEILTGGRSSRLEKKLVEERQIAASINTDHEFPGLRWNNLFYLEALPRAPHTTAELETAVWEELERLKREPVGERELTKAKNRLRAARVRDLASNLELAIDLGYMQAALGDWRAIVEAEETLDAVTADDVLRACRETFRKNRTIVTTLVEPTFEADPEKEEAGRRVVARMVEALGGEKTLSAVKTLEVSAAVKIHSPNGQLDAASLARYSVPDVMRSEFEIFGQKQLAGIDGAGAWRTVQGEILDVQGEEFQEMRADLERDLFLMFFPSVAPDYVVQAQGSEGDRERVEIRGPTGRPFVVAFDADGRPAEVTYEGKHPLTGQNAKFVQSFSDFREVSGVLQPYRVETAIDGSPFTESTVTEVRINEKLAPDTLVRPTG